MENFIMAGGAGLWQKFKTLLTNLVKKDAKKTRQETDRAAVVPKSSEHVAAKWETGFGQWHNGKIVFGSYIVERAIGKGGCGVVYLLRQKALGNLFAVKRIRSNDPTLHRLLLSELCTWTSLSTPVQPHICACRFFRTIGEETVIFAEYVDGGSLRDWITSGRLYAGNDSARLARILDIAIQSAWGLHAGHELGVIHQDVKPENILLTSSGEVKMTDYGLAGFKPGSTDGLPRTDGNTLVVTSFGGTLEYASPEQTQAILAAQAGKPRQKRIQLDRRTDIWNWAVVLLEMLLGDRRWDRGEQTAGVLREVMDKGYTGLAVGNTPLALFQVLTRALRLESTSFTHLAEAATALTAIYQKTIGIDYPRQPPVFATREEIFRHAQERETTFGSQWEDPKDLLMVTLSAAGRDPTTASSLLLPREGRPESQAIADLAAYEDILKILEDLIGQGRRDLEQWFASFCRNKANIHLYFNDMVGALALCDQAIAICERLVFSEGRQQVAHDLANIYLIKAHSLSKIFDLSGATRQYDRAIALWERLVKEEGQNKFVHSLANTYERKAETVWAQDDLPGAITLIDRAIRILEKLMREGGNQQNMTLLAICYQDKAVMLQNQGDLQGAIPLYDRAIMILEQQGQTEKQELLALLYINKARALFHVGDLSSALMFSDWAIAINERLVHNEGRLELMDRLSDFYRRKTDIHEAMGDLRGAIALHDKAIELLEQLVHKKGRFEFTVDLAKEKIYCAISFLKLELREKAHTYAREGMAMLAAEIEHTGRPDLIKFRDWARKRLDEEI